MTSFMMSVIIKTNLACLAKIVSIKNSSAVPSLLVLGLDELEAFRNRPGFSLTDLKRKLSY